MLFCTLVSHYSVFCFIYVTAAVHMHVAVIRISSQINIVLQLEKMNSEFSDTSSSTLRARYEFNRHFALFIIIIYICNHSARSVTCVKTHSDNFYNLFNVYRFICYLLNISNVLFSCHSILADA